jgi:RsfA family transcription factor
MHAKKPFSEGFREITKFLTNRTEGAINQRWLSALKHKHPNIKDLSEKHAIRANIWTDDEDILVLDKVLDKIAGGDRIEDVYEELHKLLPHRTEGSIRGRWMSELRKKFNDEYQDAHAKRKIAKEAYKKSAQQLTIQHSEDDKTVQINDVECETISGTVSDTLQNEVKVEVPVVKKLVIEEEKEVKIDFVDVQETKHLTNFLDNVTGMIEERTALKEENISLRQQNQRLNSRLKEKEDEFEKIEAKYRDVMILISRVQNLMGEQSATSESLNQLHNLKLKMERNGNLIRVQ